MGLWSQLPNGAQLWGMERQVSACVCGGGGRLNEFREEVTDEDHGTRSRAGNPFLI